MAASMVEQNGRRSRPVHRVMRSAPTWDSRAGVSDCDEADSYGAFKINGWDNPSMTMTFERLRFAGWHHDPRYNDIRRIIYVLNGASMDIIDCIFEDNTVPMSAVYHVGGGPLLVASGVEIKFPLHDRRDACTQAIDDLQTHWLIWPRRSSAIMSRTRPRKRRGYHSTGKGSAMRVTDRTLGSARLDLRG